MIHLFNSRIVLLGEKKNPEMENPNKVVNIVEKILHFNKQQKGRGLKISNLNKCFRDCQ